MPACVLFISVIDNNVYYDNIIPAPIISQHSSISI